MSYRSIAWAAALCVLACAAARAQDAQPAPTGADEAAPDVARPQVVRPKVTKALTAEQAKAAAAAAKLPALPTPAPAPGSVAVSLPALSVDEIVNRNLAARGGLAAWRNVKALSYEGRMDAGRERVDGGKVARTRMEARAAERQAAVQAATRAAPEPAAIQLPFRLDLARQHRMRLEIPFAGDTAVQVYDGQHGWKLRPFLGRREVEGYTPAEARIAASEQDLDGPLAGWREKGLRVENDGAWRLDGRDTYRLKLTLPDGEVRRLWIDAQTFLEAAIEGAPRRFDGKLRTVTTVFSDYRTVAGLKLAHSLETRVDGERQVNRLVIDKVTVNPTLDAQRFSKPA